MAAANHPEPLSWQRAERPLRIIVVMLAVLSGAAFVSMWSIPGPPTPRYEEPGWSPYGYTYSLALFAFPLLALSGWYLGHRKRCPLHGRALGLTLAAVFPLWCLVDLFLANRFFRFPNSSAHYNPMFWGYELGVGWTRSIPYEEFAFYFGAVTVMVLLYLWASEVWYARYTHSEAAYRKRAEETPPLVDVHWGWVVFALAVLAGGFAVKKTGPYPAGWPEYFLLLWGLATLPTVLLVRHLSPFLNDRALLFTVMATVLVSLLWEVTLALPNGWWDYHHAHMLGVFVEPWSKLPIEATTLWPVSAWSNVLLFELFRVKLYSGRSFRELLFGRPATR